MTPGTPDLIEHARELIDANRYLTLGTVDPSGEPWSTPVYFAADGIDAFYWCSTLDARHSEAVAAHPRVSLAVFDSTVAPYTGRAVYAVGAAVELAGDELERGLEIYPGSPDRGGAALTRDDVTGLSDFRLYRAAAEAVWVLCPRDPGQGCAAHGTARDHRTRVR